METRQWLCIGLLAVLTATAAGAADVAIPLRVYLNKPGSRTKFVAKGVFPLPDPLADNPVDGGAAITFASGAVSRTISLPAGNWTALGDPPGAKGFKYRDASGATCRRVLLRGQVIKALCGDTTPGAPPYDGSSDPSILVVLAIGAASQRYCAECPNGGVQRGNPGRMTRFTDCGAPAECPFGTPGGVCCDFLGGCGSAPSTIACLKTVGGTGIGGGAVCDASDDCVAPPGTPGDCCELFVLYPLCTMNVDQASCEGGDGTYHAASVCTPSGACVAP